MVKNDIHQNHVVVLKGDDDELLGEEKIELDLLVPIDECLQGLAWA